MKKFIALILVIGIVGCSGEQEQEKEKSLEEVQEKAPIIGVQI